MMRIIYFSCLYPYDMKRDDKVLRYIYLSICSKIGDVKYWASKIPHRLWWIFSIFVQCSNHTESSPHCFVLVNIRIPTGDTLPSVSIIEFKYILTRRNNVGNESLHHLPIF